MRLFDLPVNLAVMITGWGGIAPVPLDLGFVGMPACPLWNTTELLATVAGFGNQAVFTLYMPDDLSLVGVTLYQQALVIDPGAGNSFGAVMSDGARMVIGR